VEYLWYSNTYSHGQFLRHVIGLGGAASPITATVSDVYQTPKANQSMFILRGGIPVPAKDHTITATATPAPDEA